MSKGLSLLTRDKGQLARGRARRASQAPNAHHGKPAGSRLKVIYSSKQPGCWPLPLHQLDAWPGSDIFGLFAPKRRLLSRFYLPSSLFLIVGRLI